MIINYLIKDLCEKESVYVNNLGLFRKEYEPARIGDGIITPPGYKVVFDPDYDGNGFAFTMFVSQKGSMLITDATTHIDQWVQQLKAALDNNKSVSFENFGTFAKNDNGSISFECDRIAELNVGYEGMEPIELGKKKTENDAEIENENSIKEAKTDGAEEKAETETEDITENEVGSETLKEKDGHKKRSWIIWLVILLIAALLAAAAYIFKEELKELYQKYFNQTEIVTKEDTPNDTISNDGIVDTSSSIDSTILEEDSIVLADSDKITDEEIPTIESEEKNPGAIQLPGGEKFFIDYEKGKYYVIVGSFRSEKEVRKHIKDRKLEQYNPKVVLQQHSKNMRICIGVFDTETDAGNYGRGTGLNYWVLK